MEKNVLLTNSDFCKHEVFLKISDVIKMVALGRSTVYLKIKKNEFPKGVHVGVRGRRWRLSEIQKWIYACN